jgi:uncharacterized protein YerC
MRGVQISSQKLDKKTLQQLFHHLQCVLVNLKSTDQADQFITSFFTETEQVVLAKRLAIALLLKQGVPYESIKHQLKVSSATISSVMVMAKKEGFQLALTILEEDKWADEVIHKIQQKLKFSKG